MPTRGGFASGSLLWPVHGSGKVAISGLRTRPQVRCGSGKPARAIFFGKRLPSRVEAGKATLPGRGDQHGRDAFRRMHLRVHSIRMFGRAAGDVVIAVIVKRPVVPPALP